MAYLTVETSRETCNSSAPSTIIEGLATILLAFSEMEIDYHHSSKYSQTETMRKQRMYIFQYLLGFLSLIVFSYGLIFLQSKSI